MEDTLGVMNIFPNLRQYAGVLILVLIEDALGVLDRGLINLIYSCIDMFTIYIMRQDRIENNPTNTHLKMLGIFLISKYFIFCKSISRCRKHRFLLEIRNPLFTIPYCYMPEDMVFNSREYYYITFLIIFSIYYLLAELI